MGHQFPPGQPPTDPALLLPPFADQGPLTVVGPAFGVSFGGLGVTEEEEDHGSAVCSVLCAVC